MKTLLSLCLATALAIVPLHGQAPAPIGATVASAELFRTKEFKVSPELFSRIFHSPTEPPPKTDDAPEAFTKVKEFFGAKGIPFPQGTAATYIAASSRLIVRNTQPNLDAIEALLKDATQKLAGDADPFVKSSAGETSADPADGLWKNVVLIMEVYALPKADALAILESERGSASRYQRVLDLTAAKKARLETLTAITTKSGQRAKTDSVDEVRYPTEFEPAPAKGLAPAATSFEVRNVGDSLEIEPVVDTAAQVCDLSIAPSVVRLIGFRDVPDLDGKPNVPQPVFHSQKLTTSTSVPSGSAHYLGSLSRPSEQGIADGPDAEMSLAFLRIHLHGPQAEEIKKPAKPLNWSALNLEYSVYSMDRAQARELLLAMPTIETPWEKVKSLVAAKQARFEHLVAVQTKSGQKSTVEEIHEIIYPTEFTPPGRARVIESTTRNTTVPGQGNTEETTTVSREVPDGDIIGGAANSFETRNVGVSVEVESVVGPDQLSIELTHAISSIAYLGAMNPGPIATSFPPQPLFESRNITSNQTILASRHMFVGTFNPPAASGVNDRKDEGRTWLLFVRALPNEP